MPQLKKKNLLLSVQIDHYQIVSDASLRKERLNPTFTYAFTTLFPPLNKTFWECIPHVHTTPALPPLLQAEVTEKHLKVDADKYIF